MQTHLAGRQARNGAQRCHLVRAQPFVPFVMFVLTPPLSLKIVTLPEEMMTVAEFAAYQAEIVLLRIGERHIHSLAPFVPEDLRC